MSYLILDWKIIFKAHSNDFQVNKGWKLISLHLYGSRMLHVLLCESPAVAVLCPLLQQQEQQFVSIYANVMCVLAKAGQRAECQAAAPFPRWEWAMLLGLYTGYLSTTGGKNRGDAGRWAVRKAAHCEPHFRANAPAQMGLQFLSLHW